MKPGVCRLVAASAALVLFSGCYGKQIVKGPIYTERVFEKTDSVLVVQKQTRLLIRDLKTQLAEEREARILYQAQMGLTVRELEEAIRILTNRLADQTQLQSSGAGTAPQLFWRKAKRS